MTVILFLSSGLFLGWSLGANDAANVFGTAIGAKMVKFRTAAVITGIFVILGAGISGAGTSHTLGTLGSVNEIAGAFIVALSAAVTVAWMTALHLPVSTSQAIVGSIIGWNFFSSSLTDLNSLSKIVVSWITSPVLAGIFAYFIYMIFRFVLKRVRIHLLKLDLYNRMGLIAVGAFGAYSLGANNIANVMGVFVPVAPFSSIETAIGVLTGSQQLFILGGVAIAVGVFTYSQRVMKTVGQGIVNLTPITALIVVLASSLVLFLFASQNLESFLLSHGFPAFPLVPVSSSQAVIGALIGIGFTRGIRSINYRLLGRIASGWVTTPVIACLISFVSLFIIQNVFDQQVYRNVTYKVSDNVYRKLVSQGISFSSMDDFLNVEYMNALDFKEALDKTAFDLSSDEMKKVIELSEMMEIQINPELVQHEISTGGLSREEADVLKSLSGKKYYYKWEFAEDLAKQNNQWNLGSDVSGPGKLNSAVRSRVNYFAEKFRVGN
jgi:PiT family inorganic phosphate transporter